MLCLMKFQSSVRQGLWVMTEEETKSPRDLEVVKGPRDRKEVNQAARVPSQVKEAKAGRAVRDRKVPKVPKAPKVAKEAKAARMKNVRRRNLRKTAISSVRTKAEESNRYDMGNRVSVFKLRGLGRS